MRPARWTASSCEHLWNPRRYLGSSWVKHKLDFRLQPPPASHSCDSPPSSRRPSPQKAKVIRVRCPAEGRPLSGGRAPCRLAVEAEACSTPSGQGPVLHGLQDPLRLPALAGTLQVLVRPLSPDAAVPLLLAPEPSGARPAHREALAGSWVPRGKGAMLHSQGRCGLEQGWSQRPPGGAARVPDGNGVWCLPSHLSLGPR